MKPIVTLENVTIGYSTVIAAENISFQVNQGDYFCVVGENGTGKSTLIKGILGLLPLASGKIGLNLPKERLSYLPQIHAQARDFPATVLEVVMLGTQSPGRLFYGKAQKKAARDALSQVGMSDFSGIRIGELSGGQTQRVMLARAICRNPELMLLDEPSAGLDAQSAEYLYQILQTLNREQGLTVIMVSHELENVERFASKVAVMRQKLLFDGTVEEWKDFKKRSAV